MLLRESPARQTTFWAVLRLRQAIPTRSPSAVSIVIASILLIGAATH
jgi:hypothetical protein